MKLKIKIFKTFLEEEEIEVEIPYYYKSNNEGSFDSYGKITETSWSYINKHQGWYEIFTDNTINLSNANHGLSEFFLAKKSSKTEFENNKKECANFLNNL